MSKILLTDACANGEVDSCKDLIEQGFDVNCADEDGLTPLMLASDAGHIEIVKILIRNGAKVDTIPPGHCKGSITGRTAIESASFNGHTDIVEALIESLSPCDFGSSLTLACQMGHLDVVNILLDHGADKNGREVCCQTPLISACEGDSIEIAKMLLELDCELDVEDICGETPLSLSCYHKNIPLISLLIDKGADVNYKDKFGATALMKTVSHSADCYNDKCIDPPDNKDCSRVAQMLIEAGAELYADEGEKWFETVFLSSPGYKKALDSLLNHNI